jgi:hypothetical protein
MAKRRPVRKAARPKAETLRRETLRRARRVVEEPEIEEVEVVRVRPTGTRWFGASPWIVIVGVIGVLLILFVPMFSATKTVEKTETVMVPVQKERQGEVTVNEDIKVYQGYLEERGTTVARTGYTIRYDYWGDPYYASYTYYDTVKGSTTTVDAVDEIVEIQQTRGPDNTWVITLRAHDGTQIVHRDITSYDLTKTGKATVQVKKTVSTPYTENEPQEVTREVDIKVRVNLIKLIFGNY